MAPVLLGVTVYCPQPSSASAKINSRCRTEQAGGDDVDDDDVENCGRRTLRFLPVHRRLCRYNVNPQPILFQLNCLIDTGRAYAYVSVRCSRLFFLFVLKGQKKFRSDRNSIVVFVQRELRAIKRHRTALSTNVSLNLPEGWR